MKPDDIKKVALFGGSFNPPHLGHVLNACFVLSAFPVDQLWILPVYRHPFAEKQGLAPFEDRMEMCRRAFLPFGRRILVSSIESELPPGSKTVDMLEWLLPKYPEIQFSLVVGSDILREKHLWKRFDRIEEMVNLIVVPRTGFPDPSLVGPVMPEVSSTMVRRMMESGADPGALIPDGVRSFLQEKNPYASIKR